MVKIDTIPPLYYIQCYGAFIIMEKEVKKINDTINEEELNQDDSNELIYDIVEALSGLILND